MDFNLNENQIVMRSALRQFLQRECPIEYVRECDEAERFPVELFGKLAKEGWLGLPIPEEYGGMGGSCTDLAAFLEEFASHFEAGANIYYTTIVIATDAISHFGTEEQKRELCRVSHAAKFGLRSRCRSRVLAPTPPPCAPAQCWTATNG